MILSDRTIRALLANRDLVIDPLTPANVQPASVDFCLGDTLLRMRQRNDVVPLDPYNLPEDLYEVVHPTPRGVFTIRPDEFALASSREAIALPDNIVARVEGKSSLARLGLLVHITAGFVDPGWPLGQITLELKNVSGVPILLTPGMKIGQFCFETLDAAAEHPYGHPSLGSKYAGQTGPVGSRYHLNRRGTGA